MEPIRSNDTPTFNLKAVVQETGLKPDTLRAWERRYGLPQPDRTGGGHRLYSQHDIDTLKWLIARQDEGLVISRAVDLWHKISEEGQDPLAVMPVAANPVAATMPAPSYVGETLSELRQAWIDACLSFNEPLAENVLSQAFALFPVEVVCLDIIRRALVILGDGWHAGEISAQQEHFASELAMRRLEALLATAPPPTRPERILVACPPEESHTFSPLLISLLLRRQGRMTIYLGANVPMTQFETTIAQTKPDLVLLSAQQLHTAATLLDMAVMLKAMRIPLTFGGLIFVLVPGLASRIPGHYLGNRLESAPRAIEELLLHPRPIHEPAPAPAHYAQTLQEFMDKRTLISARTWELLHPNGNKNLASYFSIANNSLAHNIEAALRLGDMRFLGADITWLESLLSARHISHDIFTNYLRAYHTAVSEQLDKARGEPIVHWIETLLERMPALTA